MAFDFQELKKKATKLGDKISDIANKVSSKTEVITENARDKFEDKVTGDLYSIKNLSELEDLLKKNKRISILFIDKNYKKTEDLIYKAPYYSTKAWSKMIVFKVIEKKKSKEIQSQYNVKKFPTLINFIEKNEVERFEDVDSVKKNISIMDF